MFESEFEKMLRQYSDAIEDVRRFTGLVKDYFSHDSKNVNLILMAYNMGIVEDLQKATRINNTFAYRYVKQLMDDYGLSRTNADWIVSVWCVCYGQRILGKPSEISLQQEGKGPAIKDNSTHTAGKQYGDLFTYKQSMQGSGLSVSGFLGDKKQTIIFQSRAQNNEVIDIGDGVFAEEPIQEAILTDGIKYVGTESFSNCKMLHQVVLPISIREIGDKAFENCESLKSVTFPEFLERIGQGAFKGSGLRTIQITKSVYWIGNEAFASCKELDNISIPKNIDIISEGMFAECTNLRKIILHEELEEIADRAFYGCSSLDFIVIPDSVKKIGIDSFTGTDKRFIIQCSFGSYAEEYCRKNKIKYQLV